MAAVDQFDQALAVDMGIDFGRRDVGMAEHQLQRAQVRTAFEQMGGKGVAQHMRADGSRIDPGAAREVTQHLEQPDARDMALARRKQPGRTVGEQLKPANERAAGAI